uniref:Uncharacterized protein n=1 Tax=Tanacetum cinerariifolium TaxID=118510 RepID=A0A699KAI2_TANCI|nr:hypothetical protein [Tanacetum cinerariifolium]
MGQGGGMMAEPRWLSAAGGNIAAVVVMRAGWWWRAAAASVRVAEVVSVVVDRGVVVAAVAVGLWMAARCVGASDIVDRVDRVIRILFGFAGKSPPKKFFGGGVVAGGRRWWRLGDGESKCGGMMAEPRWLSAAGGNIAAVVVMRAGWWWRAAAAVRVADVVSVVVDRGVVVAAVAVGLWMAGRRVGASDIVDRVDRVITILFGFAEKSPPEKFSGGGVVADWPAVVEAARWRE